MEAADAIVVGGGGSGLAAAVSAAEKGCRVVLLEKQPQLGGATGIAVGSFTANRTVLQASAGIEDTLEDHVEDAGGFAPADVEARNNAALRRWFLSHTAETLNWLQNMGLVFHGPNPEPPNRVPRMHNVVPNAKAYVARLQHRLQQLGGTIRCNASVEELLCEDGRVVGARAWIEAHEETLRARHGVVLACGDYANSPGLIAEHKGDQFVDIEGINPFAAGDGHRLAQAAGAQLVNMDVTYGPELRFVPPKSKQFFSQLLPVSGLGAWLMGRLLPFAPRLLVDAFIRRLLVTWQHPENALFNDGAILLNVKGKRFCNERQWPQREIAIAAQPNKLAYMLLDESLIERYSAWPHFISTAPKIAYAYINDYLKLRPDIACAGTLQQIASRRQFSLKRLQAAACEAGLEGNRWALLGPCRAYFTTTEGGAAIDESLRVLDTSGTPIPGLFAVGQNGLGGQILWGHGLHIAWALTSGRLVGIALAQNKSTH
ncbi:MAG: FAD-binding dehydrogenase [Verrucomicrobiales bacterium]|nr:FAD-binding dehydrogenase [Verrucomicrobiales bacterium]|tara:strand:+ start:146 stop:1606 length:1461 start_codon:yes stop_codon:yes gene_type:complete